MSELKITIDHLKNYLGTGLKVTQDETLIRTFIGIKRDFPILNDFGVSRLKFIVPHCYRLSDLDKFIHELGFVPIEEIDNHHNFSMLHKSELMTDPTRYPFTILEALFQWHFWPFGDEYFEAGLVIDKLLHNTPSN